MKQCTKCKAEYKDVESNFYKNKQFKDGYSSWCKKCSNKYHTNYFKNPKAKEKEKIYQKKYHKEWNKKNRNYTNPKKKIREKAREIKS